MFYVLFVALNALCIYCAIKDIVETQAQDTKEIGIRREQTQDRAVRRRLVEYIDPARSGIRCGRRTGVRFDETGHSVI